MCIMLLVNGQIDAHKSQWCVLKDAGEKDNIIEHGRFVDDKYEGLITIFGVRGVWKD